MRCDAINDEMKPTILVRAAMITAVRKSIRSPKWAPKKMAAGNTIHIPIFRGINMKGRFNRRRRAFSARAVEGLPPVAYIFRYLAMGRNRKPINIR